MPSHSNSSSTFASASFRRTMSSCLSFLLSRAGKVPKSAKLMPSRMLDLPAPMMPTRTFVPLRNSSLEPACERQLTSRIERIIVYLMDGTQLISDYFRVGLGQLPYLPQLGVRQLHPGDGFHENARGIALLLADAAEMGRIRRVDEVAHRRVVVLHRARVLGEDPGHRFAHEPHIEHEAVVDGFQLRHGFRGERFAPVREPLRYVSHRGEYVSQLLQGIRHPRHEYEPPALLVGEGAGGQLDDGGLYPLVQVVVQGLALEEPLERAV